MLRYILIALLLTVASTQSKAESLTLDIVVHIEGGGNLNFSESMWAGSQGLKLSIQEFSVTILDANQDDVSLIYSCHFEKEGWTSWKQGGEKCGDEMKDLSLEAVKFKLIGKDAGKYSVRVKCHVENIGDLPFVENNEMCGTTGQGKRLEAFWIEADYNT